MSRSARAAQSRVRDVARGAAAGRAEDPRRGRRAGARRLPQGLAAVRRRGLPVGERSGAHPRGPPRGVLPQLLPRHARALLWLAGAPVALSQTGQVLAEVFELCALGVLLDRRATTTTMLRRWRRKSCGADFGGSYSVRLSAKPSVFRHCMRRRAAASRTAPASGI